MGRKSPQRFAFRTNLNPAEVEKLRRVQRMGEGASPLEVYSVLRMCADRDPADDPLTPLELEKKYPIDRARALLASIT